MTRCRARRDTGGSVTGAWSLGVYEHANGRVSWGDNGPCEADEDLDTDGVAGSVDEAKAAAVAEVRRQWARLGDKIARLDRDSSVEP